MSAKTIPKELYPCELEACERTHQSSALFWYEDGWSCDECIMNDLMEEEDRDWDKQWDESVGETLAEFIQQVLMPQSFPWYCYFCYRKPSNPPTGWTFLDAPKIATCPNCHGKLDIEKETA